MRPARPGSSPSRARTRSLASDSNLGWTRQTARAPGERRRIRGSSREPRNPGNPVTKKVSVAPASVLAMPPFYGRRPPAVHLVGAIGALGDPAAGGAQVLRRPAALA